VEKKYEKRERFTSPEGVFKFPNLTRPSTKFKPEGVYDVTIRLPGKEAKAFEQKHAKALADAIKEGEAAFAALPLKSRAKIKFAPAEQLGTPVYDEATEKPTGEVEFKFKRTASGVSKKDGKEWTATVPNFDAKGKPIQGVDIWGGTVGRVAYELAPYFVPGTGAAGLSLRLIASQITTLVTKGQASADSYGFGEVDGGYEYVAPDAPASKADAADADEADTDF